MNPIQDHASPCHVKPSLDKQIKFFKTKFRSIATRVCTNQNEKQLLTPFKVKNENLLGIGITGKHQGPSFNVPVTNQEKQEMAANLHLLNHTIPRVKIDKILNGQLQFIPRPFIMRARADWCNKIECL